jgi:hypothetical protein
METRRFPPPWPIENTGAAFVVKDSTGQLPELVLFCSVAI